jgi:hypothetical protein
MYLNPFEALQVEEPVIGDKPDVKALQRAKRKLLSEIDLYGNVSWLGNCALDTSRAHRLDDELLDPTKARYHLWIFQNKRLLRFLTHGEIEHFQSDDCFSRVSLCLLDNDQGFRAFLSRPFACQYNLVLTRALEQRLLPVVEVLFKARRLVLPEDEDICFGGADRRIGELVEQMRTLQNDGRARKISVDEVEHFLREQSLPELFNLLPTALASQQTKMVEAIWSLALLCNNEHHDYILAKSVLSLCWRFIFSSGELTERVEKSFKTIEENLSAQHIAAERERLLDFLKDSNGTPVEAETPEEDRILAEIAAAGLARKEDGAYVSSGARPFSARRLFKPGLILAAIIIFLALVFSSDSRKTAPSKSTHTPPSVVNPPAPITPLIPNTMESVSKTDNRASLNLSTELDKERAQLEKDKQGLDREKVKAERMATELNSLEKEIEKEREKIDRDRELLDRESQFEVDEFNRKVASLNRKVATYKRLLEEFRAQERLVKQLIDSYNRLVDSYNEKLRQNRQ